MLDFRLLMGKVGEGDRGKARVEEETQGNKATSQSSPSALKEDYKHVLSIYRTVNTWRCQLCPLRFFVGFFFSTKEMHSTKQLVWFNKLWMCLFCCVSPPTYSPSHRKRGTFTMKSVSVLHQRGKKKRKKKKRRNYWRSVRHLPAVTWELARTMLGTTALPAYSWEKQRASLVHNTAYALQATGVKMA